MTNTIDEIHAKLLPFIGRKYNLPKTTDKGIVGKFLETLLGIPHSSNLLDCTDGEVKTFPVKKLKSGKIVPKESMCITMLSKADLSITKFNESHCYTKMSNMLTISYFRENDIISFTGACIINLIKQTDIYDILEADYNTIQNTYIENDILESKNGTFLQTRTKGAGHGSTSRAFYLRPVFMTRYCTMIVPVVPVVPEVLPEVEEVPKVEEVLPKVEEVLPKVEEVVTDLLLEAAFTKLTL